MGRVTFAGVTKRFDDIVAVDDLSLEIHDQEFLVLLGPSGCGKSTALRMIAGLEDPSEGTISIGERVVNDVEAKDRDIAMVFQSYALYPHMTVRRNVEFPLRSRRVPPEERAELVAEAARMLALEELLDRKPAQLSGGQRQRVALARAIVRRPEAFLMDEPLSNLDAKLRVETRAELIELRRRLGATIIYVTHDQVEAMTMGDRIAVMNAGRLQQVGPPQDVYDRPANMFVASFIGNPPMNTLRGPVVTEPGGDLAIDVAGGRIVLPEAHQAGVAASGAQEVVVGVRPEHLEIGDGPIAATVSVVESLGHERHVVSRVADGQMLIVRQEHDEAVPDVGAVVRLGTDASRLHLFDATTTERIEPADPRSRSAAPPPIAGAASPG